MLLPKGKPIYENLNTSFTSFGKLLLDLKSNGFTGYVYISFWDYEAALFMDNGNIINAIEETGGNRKTSHDAVGSITAKVNQKDGSISVYSLSPKKVTMLASTVRSEVRYKDLNTDFTSLEKLIAKLKSEGHTGYIEVRMTGGDGVAIVFLENGEVVESILSMQDEAISGDAILPHIIENASTLGADFNVYNAAIEASFAESEEIEAGFDLPRLLAVWGETIGAIERMADSTIGRGQFLEAFKYVMIEKANEYPFLDPFAGLFQYKDGRIQYSGDAKNLSKGLSDCLSTTIEQLASQPAAADLEHRIQTEMKAVKDKYDDTIKRLGLGPFILGFTAD
jgi:hypothetical protein